MHKKSGNPELDALFKKSLTYSIIDGAFFSLMMGFGEYYIGAYALLLGATSFQLGLFGSVPNFLASIAQMWAPNITHWMKSRKKTIQVMSIIRTIIWLLIIIAFFFKKLDVWIVIIATSIYFAMIYIGAVPWTSWMGDLVDDKERNKYFAKRNKISNALMLIGIIVAGILLEVFKRHNELLGFIIIFSLAFIFSIFSTSFLSLKKDVEYEEPQNDGFNLGKFTREMPDNLFGKFTIFNAIMYFGVYISSPFFIAYMINILKMTYVEIMISQAVFLAAKALFFRPWAILTEKYGNIRVLTLSAIMVSLIPFGWCFIKTVPEVYFIQVITGIAWAGYELLAFNIIYEAVEQKRRAKCTSYMTFYRGIGMLLGGLLGIFMFFDKSYTFTQVFLSILVLSGFFRLIGSIYFMKNNKEMKKLEPLAYSKMVFQLILSVPKEGINYISDMKKKRR